MKRPWCVAALSAATIVAGCATIASVGNDEAVLRAVDQRERDVVASRDVAAMDGLAHPNLVINAPVNRVLTREQLLTRLGNGEIAAEKFDRLPEVVKITGDVGVVMGRELFTPVSTSELGGIYGSVALELAIRTSTFVSEVAGGGSRATHMLSRRARRAVPAFHTLWAFGYCPLSTRCEH